MSNVQYIYETTVRNILKFLYPIIKKISEKLNYPDITYSQGLFKKFHYFQSYFPSRSLKIGDFPSMN